ncbi:MAG: hypothetical protein WCR12_05410 [Dysgonamonadaceae bacterium]
MNVQLIIIILIGIAVAARLGYGIYRFFFVKSDNPYCGSCSGCDISSKNINSKHTQQIK